MLLDTYGPALDAVWGFWPDAMQLNRREAAAHLRAASPTVDDLLGLLARWARHGVDCVVVTDGPNPALVRLRGRSYRVTPPTVTPVNPIGSGDCLLAGTADAWLSNLDPEPLIRHAFACATANALVWDAGAIDPQAVARLTGEVVVEPIDGA